MNILSKVVIANNIVFNFLKWNFAGVLANVKIPRPQSDGEHGPGVGKVSLSFPLRMCLLTMDLNTLLVIMIVYMFFVLLLLLLFVMCRSIWNMQTPTVLQKLGKDCMEGNLGEMKL